MLVALMCSAHDEETDRVTSHVAGVFENYADAMAYAELEEGLMLSWLMDSGQRAPHAPDVVPRPNSRATCMANPTVRHEWSIWTFQAGSERHGLLDQ